MWLLLMACTPRDSAADAKESRSETADSTDTGTDSQAPETATETDTGAPPDTHDTGDTGVPDDTGATPVTCDAALPWKFVAAGVYQTCGIHTDGCAECWGRGKEESGKYQWETGTYYWEGEDQPPPSVYASISMLRSQSYSKERFHACGLTELGEALCWGQDRWGEAEPDTGTYVDLALWANGTFALAAGGDIQTWGLAVVPSDADYIDLAVGYHSGLGLTSSGAVVDWDVNYGLEEELLADAYTDIDIANDACGVRTDGTIRCWDPDVPNEDHPYPVATDVPEGEFVDVCVEGNDRACALDAAGALTCWGADWGEYSDFPEGKIFTQIACGWFHACGVTPEQRITCWGYDGYGETVPPS